MDDGFLDNWILEWNGIAWMDCLTSLWWNDIMFWHAGNGGNQYWIKRMDNGIMCCRGQKCSIYVAEVGLRGNIF